MTTIVDKNSEFKEVRLVDSDGKQMGVFSTKEALRIANDEYGLDLIVISDNSNPPVCKILDYSKFKYEQSKKQKEQAKRNKENQVETKELWLRPSTDQHDIDIKIRQAKEFFAKGNKVKFGVKFKGREISYKEIGRGVINGVVSALSDYTIDQALSEQDRSITVVISPKKRIVV